MIRPLDSVRRTVIMAIERGQLADILFDDRTLASHRLLASILSAILRLPPVKRTLAREQVKSRCVEALLARAGARGDDQREKDSRREASDNGMR